MSGSGNDCTIGCGNNSDIRGSIGSVIGVIGGGNHGTASGREGWNRHGSGW